MCRKYATQLVGTFSSICSFQNSNSVADLQRGKRIKSKETKRANECLIKKTQPHNQSILPDAFIWIRSTTHRSPRYKLIMSDSHGVSQFVSDITESDWTLISKHNFYVRPNVIDLFLRVCQFRLLFFASLIYHHIRLMNNHLLRVREREEVEIVAGVHHNFAFRYFPIKFRS